jgi:uncharacterized repeat protein (TIGR01451 family)
MSDVTQLNAQDRSAGRSSAMRTLAFALVFMLGATQALAQRAAEPLETRMEQHKVVMAEGRERLESADNVKPGDVIEYVATYRNTGTATLTGLMATVPVPSLTEYLPGSAKPAASLASVDGVQFAPLPLVRKVRLADGKEVDQPVAMREYRALRWKAGDLGAQKSVSYSVRVKVLEDTPASIPAAPSAKGTAK